MTYKSKHGTEWDNILACALDNERDEIRFRNLFNFMDKCYPTALQEYITVRNFHGMSLYFIVNTLKQIEVLTD